MSMSVCTQQADERRATTRKGFQASRSKVNCQVTSVGAASSALASSQPRPLALISACFDSIHTRLGRLEKEEKKKKKKRDSRLHSCDPSSLRKGGAR